MVTKLAAFRVRFGLLFSEEKGQNNEEERV